MAIKERPVEKKPPIPPKPPSSGGGGENFDADASKYSVAERWVILVAVMLGTLLEVLDTSIVNTAIPTLMGNLGATINEIGWISTGYIVANVIVLPLTGWLSSYFGRKRYLTMSILLFVTASFLCGHSHSLGELVLFRIIQGAGGAALLSTAQATLFEIFPRKQLGPVQAIFTIGVVFAPTVGPTLGGYITDNFSWPWIFYVNVPIGLLAAFLVWNNLRDSLFQSKPGKIDIPGVLMLAFGLGCFQTFLEKGNEGGWFSSNFIATLFVGAMLGIGCFIYWELTTDNPVVNLRLLKNLSFTAGTLTASVLGFGLYGAVFILPIFLQEVRGFTPTQSGMALFPGGVATVIALPFIGKLIAKVPARIMVIGGTLLFSMSMFGLSNLTTQASLADVYYPLLIRGVGVALLFLPLSLAALSSLKPDEIPSATGLYNLARQLGGSIGIALLATFVDQRVRFHYTSLSSYVNPYNPQYQNRSQMLQQFLATKGIHGMPSKELSLSLLQRSTTLQASVASYNEAFKLIGVSFLFCVPLAFLLKKGIAVRGGGGAGAH